jgi:capsular polysaccharide biosynthesis protein/Mrp family chromosome partitioning ATPase
MTEERIESGRYLRALREHWPYVAGTVALAVAAAVIFVASAQKRYEADTDLLVTPVPADSFVGVPLFRESDVSRAVVAAARIVTSPEITDRVRRRLHLTSTRKQVLAHVSVAPQEQSSILTITGNGSTRDEAAGIANAFAEALIAQRTEQLQRAARSAVQRLSQQLHALRSASNTAEAAALAGQVGALRTLLGADDPTLQIVSRAVAPETSVWPRPVLSVVVAVLAGLLLGMGIAIAIELLNPLVLTETDVLEGGGPPVLARVARTTRNGVAYRGLWANLTSRMHDRRTPQTVLVTGDGRALVTIGLATTLARAGRRVVVVDADATRSDVEKLLGVSAGAGGGMRAALVDEVPINDALTPVPRSGDRLRILTSSPDDEALLGLVPVERFEGLVQDLKGVADVVLVAAPEPVDAPDTLELAEGADAVVVAIELGRTHRARVAELRRDLGQRAIAPTGFVMIGRRRFGHRRRQRRHEPAVAADTGAIEREPVAR